MRPLSCLCCCYLGTLTERARLSTLSMLDIVGKAQVLSCSGTYRSKKAKTDRSGAINTTAVLKQTTTGGSNV